MRRTIIATLAVIAGLVAAAPAQAVGPVNAHRISSAWARSHCGAGAFVSCGGNYFVWEQGTGGGTWYFHAQWTEWNAAGPAVGRQRDVNASGHISAAGNVYSTHVVHGGWW